MNHSSFVIWKTSQPGEIAGRVAVAGDFLPAGALSLPVSGWREAAGGLESIFGDVDISLANLECPLDTEGLASRPLGGIGQIVSASSSSLDYLEAVHSLAVGIANNHSYDFGPAGVERTRTALAARNFIPLGAGRILREDPEVLVWQGPAAVRVGFWAAARASRELATRRTAGVD
ncbi:MAG: CapA family protein, partial [Bryobacteraceae bacterium]